MSAAADILSTGADRPPALDDTALFGHPRGLGLLFITEMWERFSYYGMRALLVLYLVNALKWSTARRGESVRHVHDARVPHAAHRRLSRRPLHRHAALARDRRLIISRGHFALAFPAMTTFYVGLALIIIGTGFFKSNVSTMVGQIYREGDARRDSGFTIFYMGINLGAFLGPLVCGDLASESEIAAGTMASPPPASGWSSG